MRTRVFFCYIYFELSEEIIIFVIDKSNMYENL